MSKAYVWYKLDGASPSRVEVQDGAIVDDLKRAIKTVWGDNLPCASPQLKVFAAGADPNSSTSELQAYDPIPVNTTGPNPLVVVTPQPASSTAERIPEHMVPVLLTLAVSSMKSGWERISSERTKSESSTARNNSVSYYGLHSRKTCQILGRNTAHVQNAHIWPYSSEQ